MVKKIKKFEFSRTFFIILNTKRTNQDTETILTLLKIMHIFFFKTSIFYSYFDCKKVKMRTKEKRRRVIATFSMLHISMYQ